MRYAALTHPGKVRKINEDNYYADGSVFIVADGMGGHQAGEVASTMAIETFLAGFSRRPDDAEMPRAMEKAVREANTAIYLEAGKASDKEGMGTTFTAAVFHDGDFYLAHVGDSRAYLFKDGKLEQLTEDHSLVAELVRSGRITAAQALHHPQRNIITRALGIDEDARVDIFEARVPAEGWLLLCSDGLNGMVAEERICEILTGGGKPDHLAGSLVEEALERGGSDNITVVLADLSTYDPLTDTPALIRSWEEEDDDDEGESRRRRLVRPVLLFVLALCFIITLAALFLVPLLRNRSYFVGVDEQGTIALYRGFPWKPLGINLKDVHESSLALAENLPDYKQENLRHPATMDLAGAETEFRSLTREALYNRRVPDLMGLTWEQAQSLVDSSQLLLQCKGGGTPDPAALVVEQNPAYGGEPVELYFVIEVKVEPPASGTGEGDAPEAPPAPEGGGGA